MLNTPWVWSGFQLSVESNLAMALCLLYYAQYDCLKL